MKVTAEELRRLPVSTLDEAIALSAGAVGQSYRGGRLGQQSFVLDGMGVKNQLDASTNSLGVRIPTSMVTEASLTTNAFSARYGQALSGIVNVVTMDGGPTWHGQATYESDRLFTGNADFGLDRLILQADGPLVAGITFLGVVDATGRMDASPVSAPPPTDPLDPRTDAVAMLPHNSGEQLDLAGKLMIPIGRQQTLRLFGLYGEQQGLLYDQLFKYELGFAPAQRITGGLVTADLQHASLPGARTPLVADLRVGWYGKDFHRGELVSQPDYTFGAFTGETFHFKGEEMAERLDTAAANAAVAGFSNPTFSTSTPWGVPAFFLTGGSRGEIAFNSFEEFRTQLDATIGLGHSTDLFVGAQYLGQQVQTFQRIQAYLPVGDSVPPASASDFSPHAGSAYTEVQTRLTDLAFSAGLRYDYFDPGMDLNDTQLGQQSSLNPRFAVSTVLSGATLVATYGRFSMPPDLQYLVDATFDDSTRTGRYRRGNPNLGFEQSNQFEFSLRLRPRELFTLRIGAYVKKLDGLVSTIPLGTNPDSSIFGNTDYGSVKGLEILAAKEMAHGWGLQVSYVLQQATATSTNAFLRLQMPTIDPSTGDTIYPGRVEYPLDYDQRHNFTAIFQSVLNPTAGPVVLGGHPLGALEAAAILRYQSGLPYSTYNATGDSLTSDPNGLRLPSYSTADFLIRKPIPLGRVMGSIYLDIRNVFNVTRVESVRRDTGTPDHRRGCAAGPGEGGVRRAPRADPLRVAPVPGLRRPERERRHRWRGGAAAALRPRGPGLQHAGLPVRLPAPVPPRVRSDVLACRGATPPSGRSCFASWCSSADPRSSSAHSPSSSSSPAFGSIPPSAARAPPALFPSPGDSILLVDAATSRGASRLITEIHAGRTAPRPPGFSRQEALAAQGRLEEAAAAYRPHLQEAPAGRGRLGRAGTPAGRSPGRRTRGRRPPTSRRAAPAAGREWERIIGNDLIDLYQRMGDGGRMQVELARFASLNAGDTGGSRRRAAVARNEV